MGWLYLSKIYILKSYSPVPQNVTVLEIWLLHMLKLGHDGVGWALPEYN